MYKKLTIYLALLPLLSLLVACAHVGSVNSSDAANQGVVKGAKTYREHENLATYYDGIAKEMNVKAAEKKDLLTDYEEHSYYYGRSGQDLKSHTQANLRYYEEEAQKALKKASFHRKMAAELLNREYAKPNETLDSNDTRKAKVKLDADSDQLN